jgi:hypothetical protein
LISLHSRNEASPTLEDGPASPTMVGYILSPWMTTA